MRFLYSAIIMITSIHAYFTLQNLYNGVRYCYGDEYDFADQISVHYVLKIL